MNNGVRGWLASARHLSDARPRRYQCSPLSTTGGILQQFEVAKRYDENSSGAATVLVLDEVGLAEYSPDMPLKVLHGMLVDPEIAIIGVSNWVLDPAKMNRCICLQRPTPSMNSLLLTGTALLCSRAQHPCTRTPSLLSPALPRHLPCNGHTTTHTLAPPPFPPA